MKIVRTSLFIGLILILSYLIYFIFNKEAVEFHQVYDINDEKLMQLALDSIPRSVNVAPTFNPSTSILSIEVEDFEAKAFTKNHLAELEIYKSHQLIFNEKWKDLNLKNLICSDLNANQKPEFWLFGNESSRVFKIHAYEYNGNSFKLIKFPNLMGRQKFGYFGMDSIYFVKSDIVRSFHYKNDKYAEFENGIRACFYSLGPDNSFVLKKTLDFENE